MKLMHGDELRIRYVGEMHKAWSGVGHVIKIPDSILDKFWSRNYSFRKQFTGLLPMVLIGNIPSNVNFDLLSIDIHTT